MLCAVSGWAVVHTPHSQRDGLLLHKEVHTLGMTAMLSRMFVSDDNTVKDKNPLGSAMDARIARDRHTPRPLLLSSVPSASLHSQLDALLYARWLPGRWVQRIWMLSDLPPCLEQRARSISSDAIWRAYTDGTRIWFAIAAVAVSTYGRSAVALEVFFFENDGTLCSGGLWRCHPNGDWRLERLVGTSAGTRFD
jgi:hypothetical protein